MRLAGFIFVIAGSAIASPQEPMARPERLPWAIPVNGVWTGQPHIFATPPNPPPSVVSARHLRHKVPKEAMKAYKNSERLSKRHRPDKAAEELERAIALDSEFSEAHGDLGVQYARLNRLSEAEVELRRALALDPDGDLHHSNLGWVLFWQGRIEEADTSVRKALRLAPTSASAHMLLGRLLVNKVETRAEGLKHLEYAAGIMPAAKAMLKAFR